MALPLAAAEALGLLPIPLGAAYDAAAGAGLRLSDLAPWARGGLLLLSAGDAFFRTFLASPEASDGAPDPLDRYTRRQVEALLADLARQGIRAAVRYPFWAEPDPLPFQRIGAAAGFVTPSRLGLDLHPVHGSWLAYRALLLLDQPVAEGPRPTLAGCDGCAAPCIEACPGRALAGGAWNAIACFDHRLGAGDPCAEGCHARLACPVGAASRYGAAALRFHQASSLATARSLRGG